MAYWNNISNSLKPVISSIGDGINTFVPPRDIKDSQSPDMMNLDTHSYPALSPRKSFKTVGTAHSGFTSILYSYKDQKLIKVVGNKILEWTTSWVERATLPVTPTKSIDGINFMDSLYFTIDGNKVVKVTSSWVVSTLSNSPVAKYITAHANRLYVAYDNILHYSGLRQDNNWNTVEESGQIQISTVNGEPLTGITSFANHVMTFSKNGVYELYGTGPINYEPLTLTTDIGCVSNDTIVELKQNLIWLGVDGVYSYNGGTIPKKISWAVNKFIDRINQANIHKSCAGTDGRRYYLTIPVDNNTEPNLTLVYDVEVGEWYVQDLGNVLKYYKFQGTLYYTTSTQAYMTGVSTNNDLTWYWTSKPFSDGDTARRVNWYKLYMIIDLPEGSTMDVYLSLSPDEDEWVWLDGISSARDLMRHKLIIPLGMAYDVDWVRIKLAGTGPCTIHEIQRYLRIKPW